MVVLNLETLLKMERDQRCDFSVTLACELHISKPDNVRTLYIPMVLHTPNHVMNTIASEECYIELTVAFISDDFSHCTEGFTYRDYALGGFN